MRVHKAPFKPLKPPKTTTTLLYPKPSPPLGGFRGSPKTPKDNKQPGDPTSPQAHSLVPSRSEATIFSFPSKGDDETVVSYTGRRPLTTPTKHHRQTMSLNTLGSEATGSLTSGKLQPSTVALKRCATYAGEKTPAIPTTLRRG